MDALVTVMIPVVLLIFILLGLVIFLFAFWIWMIIDAATTKKLKTDGERIAWVLIVLFLHLLGAVIYYLVIKESRIVQKKK